MIALGLSYAPDDDPLATLALADRGTISVYARNRDYHDVVKGMLKHLAQFIVARLGPAVKVFVDTAPVMEKPLAERAGIGWQGKHTNLVSRTHGSWLFLGEIYTTLDITARRAARGPLRHLHALPRRLPDQCVPCALPARCDALHLLPHHRTSWTHSARTPAVDGQSHLRLRRLPGRVPVEPLRPRHAARQAACAATELTAPTPRGPRRPGRDGFPRHVRRIAHQAHRPRPLRAQRADCHRQLRRPRFASGGGAADQ